MKPRFPIRRLLIAGICLSVTASLAPRADADELSLAEEAAVLAAVRSVADSIVHIQTVGGLEQVGGTLTSSAPTSGVIVSEDGYIICSSFNFVQQPSVVLVTLHTGKEYAAKIISRDKSRRLVLLKVEPDNQLTVPPTVRRLELRVGQWAIAVGKSFDTVEPNVSVGILSAKSRIWGRAIQTDAKVSPVNYGGPLIDIRGRVMGILVPLSTEEGSELTGSEMYDSGIGFAVPLDEINQRLDRMIAGEELAPGLLGITLQSKDLYRGKPIVASCAPKSPARQAGIVAGDEIVEVNGIPVASQAQLKHAVGQLYADDQVALVLLRDGNRVELSVKLAATIEPYIHPFVGILPQRDEQQLVLRFVYRDSPAAAAGLAAGDRLLAIDDETPQDVDQWRTAVADHEPGESVKIKYERDGERRDASIELTALPEEIPSSPPLGKPDDSIAALASLSLPEEPNKCWVIVPDSYQVETPHGLVVWLAPPKFETVEEFQARWQQLCNEYQLIVIAPQPQQANRWLPAEATIIRKLIASAVKKYAIDDQRIVIHGHQAGGSMAHRVGLGQREIVRGLAVADAALPRGAELKSNDPVERLAYYLFCARESRLQPHMERDAKGLRSIKFPVSERYAEGETRYLNDSELVELCRWIDSLDRI